MSQNTSSAGDSPAPLGASAPPGVPAPTGAPVSTAAPVSTGGSAAGSGSAGRRTGLAAVAALIVTAILGFGLTRLEFTTSQDNYLNSDSRIAKDNVEYQSLFGGEAMITLFTVAPGSHTADLFTPRNIAQFRKLQRDLDADPHISSVITPLTALEFTDNLVRGTGGDPLTSPAAKMLLGAQARDTDRGSADRRLADSLRTLGRVQAIPVTARTLGNPAWIDVLLHDNTGAIRKSLRPFFPSTSTAQMISRLTGNASLREQGDGAHVVERAIAGETFDHASVLTTGSPALLRNINNYLRGGFLTLGVISLALMAGLLLAAFAVRFRLLPLAVVAVGLIWAFGLAGYIGVPLSVVTIAGLPVLLGIDFAVQLHSRIEEESQLDRRGHPVAAAWRGLRRALLVATIAAVLSFCALQFSEVPMIRDFGTLLAIGLPVIVIATALLLVLALDTSERHRPTPAGDYTHGPLGRTIIRLGGLPQITAIPLVLASVAIFAGGIVADGKLTVQTDPEKWVNQNSQVIKDISTLRARAGSASELGVFVRSPNVFDDATASFVGQFANRQLSTHSADLVDASSLVTIVSYLLEVPNTSIVMPTGQDIRAAYAVAPPDIQRSTVNLDMGAMNIVLRTGSGSLERRAAVVNDIRANTHPPAGITAAPSGLAVIGTGLVASFQNNRTQLTYYALIAVFVLLLCHLSLVRAVLSLVPVLIAVGLSSLIALAIGVDLSPLTAVSGPLIVALCTEFTTLPIYRHLEERARGLGPREAAETSAGRTGRAFAVSALAAVIGVGVLAFSSLPLLRDFGLLVALNVAVALLSALVVLPPLLVWADEHHWVHRGSAGTTPGGTPEGASTAAAAGPAAASGPPIVPQKR
ncbi:efflux RND transporter permease subunit [Candidatus Frankia nodulisporulans]|uniref:efflux RND transporter permease subunit n=1 Tax=Candidatus Frankia nodulisporulans TaxID=2060052 RepID=UPI0013D5E3C1|nr:MMPL family transporter [Candidatus Frankia nodulisporulans]